MFEVGDTVEVILEHSCLPLGSKHVVIAVHNRLLRLSYTAPSGMWYSTRFKIIKKGNHA